MQRFIVLDTETTGLSPDNGDRVIELGCVELLGRKLSGNDLHLYFNPERDSHEDALRIHGLTTAFLSTKPKFAEQVHTILDYLRGAHLIIHNAPFDVGFLDKELSLLGLPPLRSHVAGITDSLVMAKELFPGKRNSRDALCDRLGVDNSGRTFHGALLDAQLLADVYIYMTRGQHALLTDDAGDMAASSSGQVHASASPSQGGGLDLLGLQLPVPTANAQELAAHDAVLAELDKASGGKTIWRLAESA